jgi:diguanylate cyclase (GGDEF)-like protein
MGATIRRAFAGPKPAPSAELARENVRLARELEELKAKYVRLAADAAEAAAASSRFYHLALHDPLTQLPNRLLLMDRFAAALSQARRAGTDVLVIYLDLDHFKAVNDTLGHAAGDNVLSEIGRRIAACARKSDTAGRVGGDEFVMVCGATDVSVDAPEIRSRLARAIAAPIDVNGTPITLGASIGMSSFPADGVQPAELIEKADRAMYRVKMRRR